LFRSGLAAAPVLGNGHVRILSLRAATVVGGKALGVERGILSGGSVGSSDVFFTPGWSRLRRGRWDAGGGDAWVFDRMFTMEKDENHRGPRRG
jgi:hypothetical protein